MTEMRQGLANETYSGKGPASKVYKSAMRILWLWVNIPEQRDELLKSIEQVLSRGGHLEIKSARFDGEACKIAKPWLTEAQV